MGRIFDFAVRQKAKFMRGMTYFTIVNTLMLIYLSLQDTFPWYLIIISLITGSFIVWLTGHIDIKKNIQQKENEIISKWNPVLMEIQESLKRIEEKL